MEGVEAPPAAAATAAVEAPDVAQNKTEAPDAAQQVEATADAALVVACNS